MDLDKRIAVVVGAPMTKQDHEALEDLGYQFTDEKDGHMIYESIFYVKDKPEIDERSAELRDARVPAVDAYVFTKKSHVFIGGDKDV